MGRNNWEPEDGMGFAGLVPTAAEKRLEREEDKARRREHQLRADLMAEQERNRELTRQVEQLREKVDAAAESARDVLDRFFWMLSPDEKGNHTVKDLSVKAVIRHCESLIADELETAITAPPSSSDPMQPNEYPLYLQNVDEKP